MEPVAESIPPVDGKTAERLFRLAPRQIAVSVLVIGLGAELVLTPGRTIRLLSQWVDPSRRRLLLLITEARTGHNECRVLPARRAIDRKSVV